MRIDRLTIIKQSGMKKNLSTKPTPISLKCYYYVVHKYHHHFQDDTIKFDGNICLKSLKSKTAASPIYEWINILIWIYNLNAIVSDQDITLLVFHLTSLQEVRATLPVPAPAASSAPAADPTTDAPQPTADPVPAPDADTNTDAPQPPADPVPAPAADPTTDAPQPPADPVPAPDADPTTDAPQPPADPVPAPDADTNTDAPQPTADPVPAPDADTNTDAPQPTADPVPPPTQPLPCDPIPPNEPLDLTAVVVSAEPAPELSDAFQDIQWISYDADEDVIINSSFTALE